MNLPWIGRMLRLWTLAHEQLGPAIEPESKSDLVEALLYLRRASELVAGNPSSEPAAHRIDGIIAELREAIVSARAH